VPVPPSTSVVVVVTVIVSVSVTVLDVRENTKILFFPMMSMIILKRFSPVDVLRNKHTNARVKFT